MKGDGYRRRTVLGTVGAGAAFGLAGCLGGGSNGNSGGGGGSNGDGGGLYEGGDFTCLDVGGASWTNFDAAGTAYLATFEYPDVFGDVSERGDPAVAVDFRRDFGGSEPYTRDSVILNTFQHSDTGLKEKRLEDSSQFDYETVEFGDGVAYVAPGIPQSSEVETPEEEIYQAMVPFEVPDRGRRFFGITITLGVSLQTKEGNATVPDDCAATIDETAREVARSVAPNPDSRFESAYES